MSYEVPSMESFNALVAQIAALTESLNNLPASVELTDEEKAAIQTVIALINRLMS